MANLDTAFDVEKLALNDAVLVVTGTTDPTLGYEAPVGSVYLYQNGDVSALYEKVGVADTDWRGLTPRQFMKFSALRC